MTRMRWRGALAAFTWSMLVLATAPGPAAAGDPASPALTVLAQSGQAAPGTAATFSAFGDPVINSQGLVAFQGLLAGGSADASIGLFVGTPGSVSAGVLQGQAAPGTSGVFAHPPADYNGSGAFPFLPRLDSAGALAYSGDYTANGGTFYAGAAGLFLNRTAAAVEGSPTPDGAAFHFDFDFQVPPEVSPDGNISVVANVCPCGATTMPSSGIYLSTGGRWQKVVRQGDPAPEGDGAFAPQSAEDAMGFSPAPVNDAGQIAFLARRRLTSGAGYADGLYLYSGGRLRSLATTGGSLPDQRRVGDFYDLQHGPALNAGGQVAALIATSDAGEGIYLLGPSASSLVLHTGDPDPAGSGEVVCALGNPGLGDDGTVAFTATLHVPGTPGCGTDKVLYVGRAGALHEAADVVIPSEAVLNQPTDIGPDSPYVSSNGWVAFIVQQAGTQTLSVWDGTAARRVAASGDSIGGMTLTSLDVAGEDAPGATALNAQGQLVFRAFAGNQSAIVLASLSGTLPGATPPAWLTQAPAGGSQTPAGAPSNGGQAGGGQAPTGPTVTAVSPSSGSDWGGDTVTITGTGFTPDATVQFGPYNYATVGQVSPDGTQLTVTTPPDLDGRIDIVVTTSAGTSAPTAASGFTYQPPAGTAQPLTGCNPDIPTYVQPDCPPA